MLALDADRNSDLCCRTVGLVMPLLDWKGRDFPFCVTACHGSDVIAAAWAGTITIRETGSVGCNLSYGVHPDFGGQGLATILCAIAYQQCLAHYPDVRFANVQTEAGNFAARTLATRLQLRRAPAFDREVKALVPRAYVTYRATATEVATRSVDILAAAAVEVDLPSTMPASA